MNQSTLSLIVGLGNPGLQYENTRHNVGAVFVSKLAVQYDATWHLEAKFKAEVTSFSYGTDKIWLLLPTTYMNLSGEAVQAFATFYRIPSHEILVVHDELDLLPGIVRFKFGGGSAGHNGLKSIVQHLGTQDFYRLRLGIGHPGDRDQVADYVLQRPTAAEKIEISSAIDRGLQVMPQIFNGELEKAKSALNPPL
jgi:PTH1 family peptidyl-tRNA hydrolase